MKAHSLQIWLLLAATLFTGPARTHVQQTPRANEQTPAAKRGINETDLFDFAWIADPQISPDGSQVLFYRVVPNRERTGYDGSIWMVATSGNAPPVELINGKNVVGARSQVGCSYHYGGLLPLKRARLSRPHAAPTRLGYQRAQ